MSTTYTTLLLPHDHAVLVSTTGNAADRPTESRQKLPVNPIECPQPTHAQASMGIASPLQALQAMRQNILQARQHRQAAVRVASRTVLQSRCASIALSAGRSGTSGGNRTYRQLLLSLSLEADALAGDGDAGLQLGQSSSDHSAVSRCLLV